MPTKTAVVKQVQGITLVGKSDSNHWVTMDGPETFGGSLAGSTPKELLLIALGGCTASDVIPILKKKRIDIDGFEVQLSGEVSEECPKVFTDIHMEYIIYGTDISPKDVERAIELSLTKYCAISAMLHASVNITHSYRIIPLSKQREVALVL